MQLIDTPDKARAAISGSFAGEELVAGTARIYRKLKSAGVETTPAPDVERLDGSELVSSVSDALQTFEDMLAETEISEGLSAYLKADLCRKLFVEAGRKGQGGFSDLPQEFETFRAQADRVLGSEIATFSNLPNPFFRLDRTVTLDFRSSSGKGNTSDEKLVALSGKHDKLFGIANWLANSARAITGNRNRYRIDIGNRSNPIGNATSLSNQLLLTVETYRNQSQALLAVLQKGSELPGRALFNHVGDVATAGYADALSQLDASSDLASHGCMVAHGSDARMRVSSALANCIYNTFPAMASLSPRSPLQVPGSWKRGAVERKARVKPPAERPGQRPFTILYAPNFLPWRQCYHGLVPSCFETRKCAEGLVAAFKQIDNALLNIRIKTTVKDIARPDDANENRGLLPDDLADLYDMANHIHDTSLGSHSALLEEADLVVSEGVTAVLWEALEHRKPLLLLNEQGSREPALPAKLYGDLMQDGIRNAVYASGVTDNLPKLITAIRQHHLGKPLTDAELKPYVWL